MTTISGLSTPNFSQNDTAPLPGGEFAKQMQDLTIASNPQNNDDMRIPDDVKKRTCMNLYAEALQLFGSAVLPLIAQDPERLEEILSDPSTRAEAEVNIARLEMLLDMLENQCGDVLSEGTMEHIGDLRRQLGDLRGAMSMGLVDQVRSAALAFGEGLSEIGQDLVSALGASFAGLLWMLEKALAPLREAH